MYLVPQAPIRVKSLAVRPPVEPGAIQGGNLDFFIADTHFGHANIVTYCGRPFKDELEMHDVMVQNWNKTVKPTDDVFHFGKRGLNNAKWTS